MKRQEYEVRWTILRDLPGMPSHVWCRCSCGTERAVDRRNLERGLSKSCGCLTREVHRWRLTNDGECLAPQCPCGGYESGEQALGIRGNGPATWENVASPQGALTPAGSDHRSFDTNERG